MIANSIVLRRSLIVLFLFLSILLAGFFIKQVSAQVSGNSILRMITQQKDLAGSANTAPILVQDAPGGDFEISTKVTMSPSASSQQSGIILYADDNNYIRVSYGFFEAKGFQIAKEINGALESFQLITDIPTADSFYLKLVKLGQTYTGYYSTDNSIWIWIGEYTNISTSFTQMGLTAYNGAGGTGSEIASDFDFFHVNPLDEADKAIQPGDLLVGYGSRYIAQMRNGVVVGYLDSGYANDRYTDSQGIVLHPDGHIYATRDYSVESGSPLGISGTQHQIIQKFNRNGKLVSEIVHESRSWSNGGRVVETGARQEFGSIDVDRDGNLIVGMRYSADELSGEQTVYLVRKYSTSGVLLEEYISQVIKGYHNPTGGSQISTTRIQGLAVNREENAAYYVYMNHRTPGNFRYVFRLDLASSSVTPWFDVWGEAGNQTSHLTRRSNGEIWVSMYGVFSEENPPDTGSVPHVARISPSASLLHVYKGLMNSEAMWDWPYTSINALAVDGDDKHFWVSNINQNVDSRDQLSYVDIASGAEVRVTVPVKQSLGSGYVLSLYVVPR
jgi:hypothetical protein